MHKTIVARWQDWSGRSIEHLVLHEGPDGVRAEAVLLATERDGVLAARYRISCDTRWRLRTIELGLVGEDRAVDLSSDGAGNWTDGSGRSMPSLQGAIDVDISVTPFTNTLPIRRLGLKAGRSEDIVAVYIRLPELSITTDRQRYTCLEPGRCYRYESIDGDFMRDIEVDDHGLVVTYPGLFRRLL